MPTITVSDDLKPCPAHMLPQNTFAVIVEGVHTGALVFRPYDESQHFVMIRNDRRGCNIDALPKPCTLMVRPLSKGVVITITI